MSDWKEELKKAQYTPQDSGPVVDGYDAEKIALLAYSAGLEKGIHMITSYMVQEMNNPVAPLLPLDLPKQISEHLEEQLKEVRYGRSTPPDPSSN